MRYLLDAVVAALTFGGAWALADALVPASPPGWWAAGTAAFAVWLLSQYMFRQQKEDDS